VQELLHFFGHGFCHQIPERSFEAGGLVFSVCARDTGIYLGFFFALIAAFIVYARSPRKPAELPPIPYIVVLVFFVVPMAFDGATSYIGLRPTTNTIRYLTGFLTGTAGATVMAPLLFALRRDADPCARIFAKPAPILLHLALAFLLGGAFLIGYRYLGAVAPFIGVCAHLVLVASVNLVLITLIDRFAPRRTAVYWLAVLAASLALALVEIALFGLVRDIIVHTLFGGIEPHRLLIQ
jgi:uncharacterized membrane protein